MSTNDAPILRLKFHAVSRERWICYDIDDIKIEVQKETDSNTWIAAATVDDEYGYYYGTELSEIAPERIVATTALLSSSGLPLMASLSDDWIATLNDVYADIELLWQNKRTGKFEKESVLPRRRVLEIRLVERPDKTWSWGGYLCEIEVLNVDGKWIAAASPRVRANETVMRPSIDVEHHDRQRAVELLLKHKTLSATFGLTYGRHTSLRHLYDAIRVTWHARPERSVPVTRMVRKPAPEILCPWRKIASACDGSLDCSFCGSSGSAYVIRWDD